MCKACGSKKAIIHQTNLMGEQLCWTCYEQAVMILWIENPKKQLENVPLEALNPGLTGAPQIMGE